MGVCAQVSRLGDDTMVWSALGSHANYPAAGTYLIQSFTYGGVTFTADDHTAPANGTWQLGPPTLRPTMQMRVSQITKSSTGTFAPTWVAYKGAWGKDEWVSAKYLGTWYQFGCTAAAQVGQSLSCTGPAGPGKPRHLAASREHRPHLATAITSMALPVPEASFLRCGSRPRIYTRRHCHDLGSPWTITPSHGGPR